MSFITVGAATLPSVPLDFAGNRDRVLQSIRLCRQRGAMLRTGPELELPGYGCLDHFLEGDTFRHSWEILAEIISDPVCKDMLIDLGLPVRHNNVRYNCRALCTYRYIYLIRPKQSLAQDGLYREARHFSAWVKPRVVETYYLDPAAQAVTGQRTVPIGDAVLSTLDTTVGVETCEELFTPKNPSTYQSLAGTEIFLNSSASHAELRKLSTRLSLIANSTRKTGGLYVYTNCNGIDGDARILFDGSSIVCMNGNVLAQSEQFSMRPVDVITSTVDIECIRSYRAGMSRNAQAAAQPEYPRIECDILLSRSAQEIYMSRALTISVPQELHILDPMEEIWKATALFLWQYLVRTGSAGWFIALSGGLDSSSSAIACLGMAKLVLASIQAGEETTLADLRRITGIRDLDPTTAEEIVNLLVTTCYMGTVHSSEETRGRARRLAENIGAHHFDISIDAAVQAHQSIAEQALNFQPKFSVDGGSTAENLALQNVQARVRMVTSYSLAQLATTARKLPRAGASLLVLTSGNVDEALRGYYTKYIRDVSAIGSISKQDLRAFQMWAKKAWDLPILEEFLMAIPTAELLPLSAGVQSDETEMGLTYDELSVFGKLRKIEKLGPYSCFTRLLGEWKDLRTPREIAKAVMDFFRFYAINRHKMTILTPAPHLSGYNPDDNRHDLRPFVLLVDFPFQFGKIMGLVEVLEKALEEEKAWPTLPSPRQVR